MHTVPHIRCALKKYTTVTQKQRVRTCKAEAVTLPDLLGNFERREHFTVNCSPTGEQRSSLPSKISGFIVSGEQDKFWTSGIPFCPTVNTTDLPSFFRTDDVKMPECRTKAPPLTERHGSVETGHTNSLTNKFRSDDNLRISRMQDQFKFNAFSTCFPIRTSDQFVSRNKQENNSFL